MEGGKMEVFSIPGRLIVSRDDICQCACAHTILRTGNFLTKLVRERRKKSPSA
jgi:hypothetical protein